MTHARNTMRLPAAALMCAALVLAACAQDRGTYMKSGGTNVSNDELAQTKDRCRSAAGSFGFTLGDVNVMPNRPRLPGSLATHNSQARREADLYRLCMNDRGYGRVTAEKAATGDAE